jgi:hypothetical protein
VRAEGRLGCRLFDSSVCGGKLASCTGGIRQDGRARPGRGGFSQRGSMRMVRGGRWLPGACAHRLALVAGPASAQRRAPGR